MLIVTQPPGVAIVQTVQIGSVADRAGISPGDVLLAVDGRPIHGGQDIAGALSGLNRGDRVSLQMGYGSGFSQTVVTLGAAPSVQP
jgi:serine protease Do